MSKFKEKLKILYNYYKYGKANPKELYEIQKKGFVKEKDKILKVYYYIEKNPTYSINRISKNLKLPRKFVSKALKLLTINDFFGVLDDEEIEMLKFLLNYSKRHVIEYINFCGKSLFYNAVELLKLIKSSDLIEYKRTFLIYNDYVISDKFPPEYKIEKINYYIKEFERKGFMLSYYLLTFSRFELEFIAYGIDNLVEFYLSKENIINNLPKVVRMAYFNALLNLLPRKGYIRKTREILRKVINYSKKEMNLSDRYVIYDRRTIISAAYFSIGDYKNSLKWANEGSEIEMFSKFMMGEYREVINKNFDKAIISKNWNIQNLVFNSYIILSFLMLDKIEKAVELFESLKENYLNIGYLKPFVYIYYLIYYAKIKNKEKFQKTFLEATNEAIENLNRDFYRILYAIYYSKTNVLYSTYHEKTIKCLIKGNFQEAQKLVNEYGTKFFYDLFHILKPVI